MAQNVEISGNALFFAGEKIEVLKYSNRISHSTESIETTTIDLNGHYQIQFNLRIPTELFIRIEMRDFAITVHPNTKIELHFLPIENSDNQKVPLRTGLQYTEHPVHTATQFDYQNLRLEFAHYQSEIELDLKISKFYTHFFDSIAVHYASILDSDSLFMNHFKYFKANCYMQSEQQKSELFERYILSQPIQYDNPEYLRLFANLTGGRIFNILNKNKNKVNLAIKQYKVYDAFMDILAQDTFFTDLEVRSLALLSYSIHPRKFQEIPNTTWTSIIHQMSNFCIYPVQKEAAFDIQENRNTLLRGSEAPLFDLINSKGEFVSLHSFRGRHTYIGFIHSKSRTCVNDIQTIQNYKKKYPKVNYVFVICDRDSLEMKNLPKESRNLKYLYLNKDYTVLQEYQIWNFPVYYFLDTHGYFLQSPAKNPIDILDDFRSIFAPKSHHKGYEIIKN